MFERVRVVLLAPPIPPDTVAHPQASNILRTMKTLAAFLALVTLGLMIATLRTPVGAQAGSLEERVRSLEIQVSALNQRVTALERGGGVVGDGIRRTYTGIGETWIIKQMPTRGTTIITLGNGTRWQIDPADGSTLTGWRLNEVVQIGTNPNQQYPYTLTNQTRKQKVAAQYLGQS